MVMKSIYMSAKEDNRQYADVHVKPNSLALLVLLICIDVMY